MKTKTRFALRVARLALRETGPDNHVPVTHTATGQPCFVLRNGSRALLVSFNKIDNVVPCS